MFKADTLAFAKMAHEGQKRKYSGEDYVVHPMRVAALVAHYLGPKIPEQILDHVIDAALLHDVVEDTKFTVEDIEDRFGTHAACLVEQVTNPSTPQDGNREARKAIDRAYLAESDELAASIKLADIIDNVPDIVAFDPGFAKTYIPEKIKALDVLGHGDVALFAIAGRILDHALETLDVNTS